MCARFTQKPKTSQWIEDMGIGLASTEDLKDPRFPTYPVIAIRGSGSPIKKEAVILQWGLIPYWAKDSKIGRQCYNARSETIAVKPSFKRAFRSMRCLIPADAFYEWGEDEHKKKQLYRIGMKSGQPFMFAGLWETWTKNPGEIIESCTIVTCPPNSLIEKYHDRMPVILDDKHWDLWLDSRVQETDVLSQLLIPHAPSGMSIEAA